MTSVDVAKALWKTDFDGITGKIVFDENGDSTFGKIIYNFMGMFKNAQTVQ